MELKTFALQWLKDHDQLGEIDSPKYLQAISVIELFETLEEQPEKDLKKIISTFALITSSFYTSQDDW